MKIATWNVNSGAIADRLSELRTEHDADIVALQETAAPVMESVSCFWSGDLKHKGVAVSSKIPCTLAEVSGETSPIIGVRFADSDLGPFNLLCVWAKPAPSYFADLSRTFNLYASFIRERPTVILGDFNMSARLLQKGRQFYLLNARLNHDYEQNLRARSTAARGDRAGL